MAGAEVLVIDREVVDDLRRRVRQVVLSHELWEQLLCSGDRPAMRVNGIPEGAEVIFQEWRPEWNGFSIVVRHESFEPIKDWDELPMMPIEATEIEG